MEPAHNNVPLVDTTAADTLFEGQTWGWDGIDLRAVVSQNQNDPSFKNVWIPQILSYIDIFLYCLPLRWLILVIHSSTYRAMKEADVYTLKLGEGDSIVICRCRKGFGGSRHF